MDSAYAISQIDYSAGDILGVVLALAVLFGVMSMVGKGLNILAALILIVGASAVYGVGVVVGLMVDRTPESSVPAFFGAAVLLIVFAVLRKRYGTPFGTRWI